MTATSSASASPLLGGYGGPGEGNQAILGSALLNGPRGGGPGTGSGSAEDYGLEESSSIDSTKIGAAAGGARVPARGSEVIVRSEGGKRSGKSSGHASGEPSSSYPGLERNTAARLATADSGTLGLSGADLLYVLLALGVLALTAVLTGRLARIPGREAADG